MTTEQQSAIMLRYSLQVGPIFTMNSYINTKNIYLFVEMDNGDNSTMAHPLIINAHVGL